MVVHQPRIIIVFSRLTLSTSSSVGSFGRHLIHNHAASMAAGRQRLIVAGHQCVGAVPHGQPRAKERWVGRWPLCSPAIVFRVSQSAINQRSTHKGGRRPWTGWRRVPYHYRASLAKPGLRVADTAAFIYADCALARSALSCLTVVMVLIMHRARPSSSSSSLSSSSSERDLPLKLLLAKYWTLACRSRRQQTVNNCKYSTYSRRLTCFGLVHSPSFHADRTCLIFHYIETFVSICRPIALHTH